MKLTDKALEKVDKRVTEKKREFEGLHTAGLGFNVETVGGRSAVFRNTTGYLICELEELSQTIAELTAIKEAIAEAIGIEF